MNLTTGSVRWDYAIAWVLLAASWAGWLALLARRDRRRTPVVVYLPPRPASPRSPLYLVSTPPKPAGEEQAELDAAWARLVAVVEAD